MPLTKHQNIPPALHRDDKDVVNFLQRLLDNEHALVLVGSSIKWGSTSLPNDTYLFKAGQTVNKSDYEAIWTYAQNDPAYSTTATTVTLPVDVGFVLKAK